MKNCLTLSLALFVAPCIATESTDALQQEHTETTKPQPQHPHMRPLKELSAKKIAQEIWDGERVVATENLTELNITEDTKILILYELRKPNGIIDTIVQNWHEDGFGEIETKPEWLRREFARKWFLRKHKQDISSLLNVTDIGGFSINELLAFGTIQDSVPRHGSLNLYYHKINSLDGLQNIKGFSSIKELFLGFNKLQKLEEKSFTGLTHLKKLILINNQLQTLPTGIFNELSQLTVIDLSNNPLSEQGIPAKSYRGRELQDLRAQLHAVQ